ncbi:Uncharacterised protein [uncultured Ruminococcus sp.]|uniref:Sarcolemmal membrane-associated protein n=1 Tax=Hydrogeniiclostridium mannosilyticum TaxID=2764322 RepID=A0A328UCR5_9FIRM|nr:hypothetical protein [Hydrogeniiclostridium mannosilyticum]RAQ28672.1 hypothetical protein DPQ25_07690 [Hydrogeniiclostridium mannosilyticum]SCH34338.1 Uncharacterised protein [uncultured Ruminococcus sp.]
MKELNLLTQRLFAEGWIKEKHPDYVRDWNYTSKFYGGFEYTREHQNRMVFSTPCGLLVKGSHWNSGHMAYMGVNWTVENDNPTICCPYRKAGCEQNHPLLRDRTASGPSKMVFCACHEVDVPYCYERSIEKVSDEYNQRKEALFQSFARDKKRICRHHCYFDEHTETWVQRYDPMECARSHTDCHYCTILGKELDTKKGNIFYDLKTTRKTEELTLFAKEYEVAIRKDKKLLERNVSLDICRAILKVCPDAPQEKAEGKYSRELYFSEYHGMYFKVEAVNVRVECRASRDLEQDIADAQAGYTVTHEADTLAAAKQQKSERREKARQARIRKAKKLILQHGMDGLLETDLYRVRRMIDKGLITGEEIFSLEHQRTEQQSVEQMTLFQEEGNAHT